MKVKCKWKCQLLSCVWLLAAPRAIVSQAPLPVFSRQEYWNGFPCPSPRDLPNPGIEPRSLALLAGSLPSETPGKPYNSDILLLSEVSPRRLFPWILNCDNSVINTITNFYILLSIFKALSKVFHICLFMNPDYNSMHWVISLSPFYIWEIRCQEKWLVQSHTKNKWLSHSMKCHSCTRT